MIKRTGLFAESWNVAWRKINTASILSDKDKAFNIIENDIRYWAADPFLFKYEDELFIFAELYNYMNCRGGIGYCKWNGAGFGRWKKVISEPYHLSYPFIFKKENDVFIMPESGADSSLYLYHAIHFPDIWERVDNIREGVKYGDTTPFEWNQHHYALTYDVHNTNDYKLILLDLENDKNDRILDALPSPELRRPAGKIIFFENSCIRPAQNCAKDYGEGLVFYALDISQNKYSEKVIQIIKPQDLHYSKNILMDGIHTYNVLDGFEVIDIKTRRFNMINLLFRIAGKLKKVM